ncbi:MAG: FAD binding domain-containing protein [Candidatus Sumerlaeia bacterium]|nr:FAD binding domain-containing protein [Candidatus Sumerlaeia bacterium]
MVRLKHIKNYIRVKSISEALKIIAEKGGNSTIIAGGTSFTFRRLSPQIDTLMDITFAELNYLKLQQDKLCVGATTTLTEIADSAVASELFNGILLKSIRATASTCLRNIITIGGNLVGVFSWSTLPLVLSLLEARLIFQSSSNTRIVNAIDLYSTDSGEWRQPGEILTEIQIPLPETNDRFYAYKKFSRTATEFAWISLGVNLDFESGTNVLKRTRVLVGAMSPLPQQLIKTEETLNGNLLNDKLIEEALITATEEVKISKDLRCSKEYKREILAVLLRDILTEILNARMQQFIRNER